jgi:hypothetical protein
MILARYVSSAGHRSRHRVTARAQQWQDRSKPIL